MHAEYGGYISVAEKEVRLDQLDDIVSGRRRGLSPGLKVRRFDCSMCGRDLEVCEHEVGSQYGNVTCRPIPRDIQVEELSLVEVPEDPAARVTDLLIVDDSRVFHWYGFPVESENHRFKSIQSAFDSKLISLDCATHFLRVFGKFLVGEAFWREAVPG